MTVSCAKAHVIDGTAKERLMRDGGGNKPWPYWACPAVLNRSLAPQLACRCELGRTLDDGKM